MKFLSREFWYTSVCVGSNPTPVRKRFEHDETQPSADKFCHTGTLCENDSPNQKRKKSQRHPWPTAERFISAQKEDNQPRHVKHESTRGLKRKSFEMDDTNRSADYISKLKSLLNGKATHQKKKCVDGNQAGWPTGLRRQTQELPQSRNLVHECVRGFESHSCQKTF